MQVPPAPKNRLKFYGFEFRTLAPKGSLCQWYQNRVIHHENAKGLFVAEQNQIKCLKIDLATREHMWYVSFLGRKNEIVNKI